MVNESFCSVCQKMLAMQCAPQFETFPHHPDGESFRQAVQLGCRICSQFWSDIGRPSEFHPVTWGPRYASSPHNFPIAIELSHLSPDRTTAYLDLETWDVDRATPLSDNTGSDESFAFLSSAYKQCRKAHKTCSSIATKPCFPPRLLNVGDLAESSVHLVNREDVLPGSDYVTLSHCWGDVQPFKLTSSTSQSLRAGIPDVRLPKTFRHAITVVRRLEIRYLWIDSL